MSQAGATETRTNRVGVRLVALAVVIALLLVAAAVYLRLGYSRMESSCESTDSFGQPVPAESYSWRWQPLGFTCTYSDGTSETSLWP